MTFLIFLSFFFLSITFQVCIVKLIFANTTMHIMFNKPDNNRKRLFHTPLICKKINVPNLFPLSDYVLFHYKCGIAGKCGLLV